MLRPKEMVRVLIAGPLDLLPRTIDLLYELKILHIVDFEGEDETFRLGRPLEQASEISEALLKLRSIASVLELEKVKGLKPSEVGPDAAQRLKTLEINIREEDEGRKRVEDLIRDLDSRIDALRPFADLALDFSLYSGYENVTVFVGRIQRELEGLDEAWSWEVFRAGDVIALFVERDKAEEVSEFLSRLGFTPLEVPAEEGDPRAMLQDLVRERERWQGRLREIDQRLEALRERFASFVISAEDFLTQEIEKAEAPLRFATSDHSFISEGWVPKDSWPELEERLGQLGGLYIAQLEDEETEEEPPVLLDNPKPVRPFELLTSLFSTPSYKEIDPTLTLFVVFPTFFGLMVGDLGYGAVLMIIGLLGLRKAGAQDELRRFLLIIVIAGLVTAFFGAFLYAEAFGIPFHPPEAHEAEGITLSWSGFLGTDIPIHASIHKLTDVGDLLILSVVAGTVHLGLGFIIGFVNEIRHSKRHAITKAAWIMVLLGLFITLMAKVRWNRIAAFLWRTVLAPIPLSGLEVFGFEVPWVAFGLLIVGAGVVGLFEYLATQNPVAIIEVASLLANMISYTRLAGIAVAKAAIAEALNTSIFQGLIFSSNVGLVVVGAIVLVMAQMLVLGLGALSSGIQALRLNYVEFFMKFFKGNGIPFQPFGRRAAGLT